MMASILIINRVIYCANEAGEESPQSCQHLFTPYLFMLGFETVLFFSFTGAISFLRRLHRLLVLSGLIPR